MSPGSDCSSTTSRIVVVTPRNSTPSELRNPACMQHVATTDAYSHYSWWTPYTILPTLGHIATLDRYDTWSSGVVCLCVCVLATLVSSAKTAEPMARKPRIRCQCKFPSWKGDFRECDRSIEKTFLPCELCSVGYMLGLWPCVCMCLSVCLSVCHKSEFREFY